MDQFTNGIVSLVAGQTASEQGGIISGDNPTHYNAKNPLRLWVIQVGIIIVFTQLLSLILGRIRQPRVIAEVIGGVILGPTVMGRIPHFTNRIFPVESIPLLALTANIGLVFFLFLVGLEIDTRILKRNAKASMTISAVGLILPLGLGAALAVPIYHEFIADTVNFGYFVLFVAVAIGITAFPVLCRILTELRLLDTTVGVVTLSAGIGNDVVGWILLALVVTLVNSSGGLTALYVLLAAVAYVLVVLYPVRWAFHWLIRKTGCLENGHPSMFVMTATLLLVLVSALFTDIIGIHAIFGGFVAGLIIPHEGGFAIALVEKLEDLITLIFLPIYFTLSGLNTNLGLLDTGKTWGYTILICVVAFFAKFLGCFVTAKLCGFNIRESGAIGTLMSCKGLVELIVLNVGLQAGILDTRTFSMFVLHALVLTFMTTPLTLVFYPLKYRTRATDTGAPKDLVTKPSDGPSGGEADDALSWRTNLAMVFSKVEHLPALMSLVQLLQVPPSPATQLPPISENTSESEFSEKGSSTPPPAPSPPPARRSPLIIHALRLVELTHRTSAVLRSQEASEPELAAHDAVLAVFRTFAHLHRVVLRTAVRVVSSEEFAGQVATFASEGGAQMVVIPWAAPGGIGGTLQPLEEAVAGPNTDATTPAGGPNATSLSTYNPFENLFGRGERSTVVARAQFVRKVFMESPVDVALFVDRSHPKKSSPTGCENTEFEVVCGIGHHIFLPFFGGPDDRLALSFVVQLCANPLITATVVRIKGTDEEEVRDSEDDVKLLTVPNHYTVSGTMGPDTVYGHNNTQTRLVSDTADNILWSRCASPDGTHSHSTREALRRITFTERSASRPLRIAIELSNSAFGPHAHGVAAQDAPSPIIVVGRGRRMASESHRRELAVIVAERGPGSVGSEVSKAMGDVAAGFIASGNEASLLVLQAAANPFTP